MAELARDKVEVVAFLLNRVKPRLSFQAETKNALRALEGGARAALVFSRILEGNLYVASDDANTGILDSEIPVFRLGDLLAINPRTVAPDQLQNLYQMKLLFGGDLVEVVTKLSAPAAGQQKLA